MVSTALLQSLLLGESIVLFVCSTTGDGEEPDNMKVWRSIHTDYPRVAQRARACIEQNFWRFLRQKDLPPGILNHVQCGVFGLGDSSYSKYVIRSTCFNGVA
jgi:sulfite reductase alpha subunit-like flavoprotein